MSNYSRIRSNPKIVKAEDLGKIIYHLHPSVVPTGKEYHVYLTEIQKDGQQHGKIKFLRLAERALTQLSRMKGPVQTFSEVLRSIAEDRGVYEYEFGVFFMLYAQFQRKFGIDDNHEQVQTSEKMKELIAGNEVMLKSYHRDDQTRVDPLPIFIRNAIVHHGTNQKNTFTPHELSAAVRFLRSSLQA